MKRVRKYREEWEKIWPWLTKVEGEERAWCKVCQTAMGASVTKFKDHSNTYIHKKNSYLEEKGAKEGFIQGSRIGRLPNSAKGLQNVSKKNKSKPQKTIMPTFFDNYTPDPLAPISTDEVIAKSSTLSNDATSTVFSALDFKGIQVKVLDDVHDNVMPKQFLATDTQVLMQIPVIPICTLKANAQHLSWYQDMMSQALSSGLGYDAVWQCKGALFRVHKFVLAASSAELKNILPDNEEEIRICTPDLSRDMVEAMLLTMYTGQAVISWKLLQEINVGFKSIGFCGKNMAASPYDMSLSGPKIKIDYAAAKERLSKQDFTQIQLLPDKVSNSGLKFFNNFADNLSDIDNFMDTECLNDSTPDELVKIELEDDVSQDSQVFDVGQESKKTKLLRWEKRHGENVPLNNTMIQKDLDVLMDKTIVSQNELSRPDGKSKRDRLDYRETRVTYPVIRKNGVLSKKLPFDLFDSADVARKVKLICICPFCFKVFHDKDQLTDHRTIHHDDIGYNKGPSIRNWHNCIQGKYEYKCNKCDKSFKLQHLVWFVKHIKFCGVNDEKANEILHVGQTEEAIPPRSKDKKSASRPSATDKDVLHVLDRPHRKKMSQALLGKVQQLIWGCRKCYQVFDSEIGFKDHVQSNHNGKIEHGSSYDAETNEFICKVCNVYRTNKTVVTFIYHKSTCNVQSQGAVVLDDEEDFDEDTYDEYVDPWGIIFRPLKVNSRRANWICESLFDEIVDIIYPCHLCYTPFKSEEEIREHFRLMHPDNQNFIEDGIHYDKDKQVFVCPHCKLEVCKNQRNSIYFTYHMRKCNNQLFNVTRSCPTCNKSFSNFHTYVRHLQNKCGQTTSMCHICSMVFKTKEAMKTHVKYVHTSNLTRHKCTLCESTFKREADLKRHFTMHMGSQDWSCDKCGKAFTLKRHLQAHIKTHMTEAEKRHVCHLCGNRFARKEFLVDHMATHTSFRGFKCDICSTTVKTKTTLRTHRVRVHKLKGAIPPECILQPEPGVLEQLQLDNIIKSPLKKFKKKRNKLMPDLLSDDDMPTVHNSVAIKEEVLPLPELGEALELS